MRILKITGIVVGAVLLVLVVVGLMLPAAWRVERSVVIAAPAEVVFPFVADLRRWEEWTVWNDKLDPSMTRSYEGPQVGVGASSRWQGEKLGSGRMQITAFTPNRLLAYELHFEGYDMPSRGAVSIEPQTGGVRVTWTDAGEVGMNLVGRYFALGMDRMIGPDFEGGLTNLKRLAEAAAAGAAPRAAAQGAVP